MQCKWTKRKLRKKERVRERASVILAVAIELIQIDQIIRIIMLKDVIQRIKRHRDAHHTLLHFQPPTLPPM